MTLSRAGMKAMKKEMAEVVAKATKLKQAANDTKHNKQMLKKELKLEKLAKKKELKVLKKLHHKMKKVSKSKAHQRALEKGSKLQESRAKITQVDKMKKK